MTARKALEAAETSLEEAKTSLDSKQKELDKALDETGSHAANGGSGSSAGGSGSSSHVSGSGSGSSGSSSGSSDSSGNVSEASEASVNPVVNDDERAVLGASRIMDNAGTAEAHAVPTSATRAEAKTLAAYRSSNETAEKAQNTHSDDSLSDESSITPDKKADNDKAVLGAVRISESTDTSVSSRDANALSEVSSVTRSKPLRMSWLMLIPAAIAGISAEEYMRRKAAKAKKE